MITTTTRKSFLKLLYSHTTLLYTLPPVSVQLNYCLNLFQDFQLNLIWTCQFIGRQRTTCPVLRKREKSLALKLSSCRNKTKRYNAIHKHILFPLKCRLMVTFPKLGIVGNSTVFRPFYKGPYEVLERVRNVNYRVRSLTTPYKIILVHCKRLRHCRQRLDHLVTPDSSQIPSLPNSSTADLQTLRR
jgi:hypothetical protein